MQRYFMYCRKSTENEDGQSLSLESQRRELERYAAEHSLQVVDVLLESRSARSPGRPLFKEMLSRITHGEAQGILAWHPNRLARNAVDGGQILYYLDTGKLTDLRFPTIAFENSPQGKFMLMILFGQSKYEVDTLSEVVKRGNRTKRELGWLPGRAPLGYLNISSDSGARVIARDPERFPAVKKLWELFLSGTYTGNDLLRVATTEMNLRSKRTWHTGGKLLSRSALYRILRNPFYAGHIVFKGAWFPGSHEAMITVDDFNRAQTLLRGMRVRPRSYRFAYGKLIRCGACGSAVTAEHKRNRYGSVYTYYHCTHMSKIMHCRERSLEEHALEEQIISYFSEIGYGPSLTSQESLRSLLTLRASAVTLKDKKLNITLKEIK